MKRHFQYNFQLVVLVLIYSRNSPVIVVKRATDKHSYEDVLPERLSYAFRCIASR